MLKKNVFGAYLLGALALSVSVPALGGVSVPAKSVESTAVAVVPVKGKVVNEKGEALPGVNILVKGHGTGTITDVDGKFSIQLPTDGQLLFSYIGYYSTERNAADESNLTVVMREDAQTLGEVVVTTQKRSQSSIEVPAAISAVTGSLLKKLNLQQMDQVADFIPGVQIQLQSPNNPGYVIRGVTSDGGESYAQPRVSVFQDGVSISRSQASVVELFDLERLEVVKGPQGTLFGRGAEIGGIHVIRNKPVDYTTGEVALTYGTHNQRSVNGYINTPLNEKLANRFAMSYDAHDGFIKNEAGGRLNGKSALALRNSTRLWANDKTTYDLVLDYQWDNYPGTSFKSDKSGYYTNTDPNSAANLEMGKDLYIKRHVGGATFLADHAFGDDWKMTSTTGFRAFKSDESFDADGTPASLLWCEEKAKGTQFSQEFRFNYDNKSWLSGFFGASYFFEHSSQEVIARSNLQQMFPTTYLQTTFNEQAKPGLTALGAALDTYGAALGGMLGVNPAMLKAGYEGLMSKWFPASHPAMTDGQPTAMTTTPDFYGDLNNLISQATGGQMSLDALLSQYGALLPEALKTGLASIKASSAIALNNNYQENGTNYGTNQAAEVFADGTFRLAKNLALTVGLRGTYEHQYSAYSSTTAPDVLLQGKAVLYPSTEGAKVSTSDGYYSWVGRVALNYMLKRNNFYVSVSRGRRPAVLYYGINDDSDLELYHMKAETILSYEAGVKGMVFDGKLNYDLCAYYYDWNHFQSTRQDESGNMVPMDAGKAHTFGVEAGLRYSPCRYLSIFGNYSYIDGKFNDTDEDGAPQEYAGNRFRLTPKNSYALGVDVNIPTNRTSEVFFRPTYTYKSKVYFEEDNTEALSQDGYGIANFNLGYRFHPRNVYYEISAFGKNVFDEKYIVDAGNSGKKIGYPTFVGGSRSVFGVQFKIGF